MGNNVTGSDVLNKDVSSLVAQNQSTNETNISASLNTRVVTAQDKYTANKDAILGDTFRTSNKKKTFSVFETKQAITPLTPPTIAKITTELDSITPQEIIYLEKVSGMKLTSDADLERARQMQNELVSGKVNATRDPKLLGDESLYELPEFIRLGDTGFTVDDVTLSSKSLTSEESFAKNVSLFGSSFTPPILGQVAIPETELGKFSAGMSESKNTLAWGSTFGTPAGDLSLDAFLKMKADMSGPLKDFNGCPDLNMFDGGLYDLRGLLASLLALLDLNIDIGCFNELISQMGGPDVEALLNKSVSLGSIVNVNTLVDNIGADKILDPPSLIKATARSKPPAFDMYGNPTGIENFESEMDILTGKFGLSRADVFGTTDDVMDIKDIASYPNNDTLTYAYGDNSADMLRSLPMNF